MYVDPQRNNQVRRLTLNITPKEELSYHRPRPANENAIMSNREQSPQLDIANSTSPVYSIPKDEIQILKERQAKEKEEEEVVVERQHEKSLQVDSQNLSIIKELETGSTAVTTTAAAVVSNNNNNHNHNHNHHHNNNNNITQNTAGDDKSLFNSVQEPLTVKGIEHDMLLHGKKTSGKYTFQDFQILRTLGTGSFGRVHLIRSNHNGRFYALKVLKKKTIVKFKQVEHTNDERKILSIISHPFLIRMWGTFQDSQQIYMVMDFIEGGELFSLLRKSKRFPNPVAKFYAAEICLALEYLHDLEIIYRDLKPENILLDRNGHIKITDFGFAKYVPDVTYTLCGTPDYIAPEVVSTKPYNKSVDWWSFGIIIYEMLAGYTPFYDSNTIKIYEKILNAPLKFPEYFDSLVQDLLRGLINRNLSQRLGNLQGGTEDVKNHPWFEEVVWDKILARCIETPYEPPIRHGQGDSSQFDRYPEEELHYGFQGEDPYHDLFKAF
ncbi:cAMP-dependent protein kinase PWA37_002748 [Arxiozyma heterogenica]|uniref:cAMP-dependent protein kinase n=2 Tax=Arxiozyma heterogenica TaxID=278026 RepID=UPI002EFE238B